MRRDRNNRRCGLATQRSNPSRLDNPFEDLQYGGEATRIIHDCFYQIISYKVKAIIFDHDIRRIIRHLGEFIVYGGGRVSPFPWRSVCPVLSV